MSASPQYLKSAAAADLLLNLANDMVASLHTTLRLKRDQDNRVNNNGNNGQTGYSIHISLADRRLLLCPHF